MLPRQHSNASSFLPPGSRGAEQKLAKDKDKDKDKDSRKKGGSNPPKPLQETVVESQRDVRPRKRQDSAPAPSSVRSPPPANPAQSTRPAAYEVVASPRRREHADIPAQAAPPAPAVEYLTVPSAGMGVPPSNGMPTLSGRSPTKMFSPFPSVEAVDGTVANTVTGADSTRSSTAGRLSPPLRDPQTATHDWRNKEEAEFRGRGTRRRRPGVTFDRTTTIRAPSK
ncbi:uncharacterized protein B0H18DRAFT_1007067, partial [Fomitopsis serialis]|uniref:uncharacterized protein n=1 Tax=Fomitopsis serialis TaxID=139415 RepID=UPI002008E20A